MAISFILFIICLLIGFLQIIKGNKENEFFIIEGVQTIVFGICIPTWYGWFEDRNITNQGVPIYVPIICTLIFGIMFIGKKVYDGYWVKEARVKKYNKEKVKLWDIE